MGLTLVDLSSLRLTGPETLTGCLAAQAAITADPPAPDGPARIVCSLGSTGMELASNSAKLILMEVGRCVEGRPRVDVTVPGSSLRNYQSPNEIVVESATRLGGGG